MVPRREPVCCWDGHKNPLDELPLHMENTPSRKTENRTAVSLLCPIPGVTSFRSVGHQAVTIFHSVLDCSPKHRIPVELE